MSNHLRHCQRHKKPLPCPHCAAAPTAAAVRAARFRAKQKANNPDFNKQEAERRSDERKAQSAETDRINEIEKALKVNSDNQNNIPFVMQDAPHGKGELVTGVVDPTESKVTDDAVDTGRVAPSGLGDSFRLAGVESDVGALPKESDYSFAPTFKKDRNVKTLHKFVFENTKLAKMEDEVGVQTVTIVDDRKVTRNSRERVVGHRVCLACREQISLGNWDDDIEAAFHHFEDRHPEAFKTLMGRIEKVACQEDHAGMVRRHGGGDFRVECKECGEVLYKPPRGRSDRLDEFDFSEIVP